MLARWRTLVSAQVRHGGTAESRAREALVQRRARAAPEHSWFDRLHATRAMERTFARVYPQLAALDLARDVPRLDVPVTLALSPHDLVVPPDAAVRWLASLEAPRTSLVWFERSGHVPQVSEAEKFAGMLEEVLGTALRA
jgi:pimeloyl-ACP methyl ester carboxylesterase